VKFAPPLSSTDHVLADALPAKQNKNKIAAHIIHILYFSFIFSYLPGSSLPVYDR
jgi:hypothetical protein